MTPTFRDVIGRLHATLENLAGALETGESDRVLEAEAPLAEAVRQLTALAHRGPVDPATLRAGVIAIGVSMQRCRTLGRCAEDFANAISPSGYGSSGARVGVKIPGTSVTARS